MHSPPTTTATVRLLTLTTGSRTAVPGSPSIASSKLCLEVSLTSPP